MTKIIRIKQLESRIKHNSFFILHNSSQKGISGIIILVVVGVVIAVGVVFFGINAVKNQSAPGAVSSPEPELSSESSPASLENDPSYNLVKEKFDLNEEQLEILSRVSDNDNKL